MSDLYKLDCIDEGEHTGKCFVKVGPKLMNRIVRGLTLEEAVIDTDEDDTPPAGWHICDCSEDCGAWEPDDE